jgi:starvation-inducible DNA-binding protein
MNELSAALKIALANTFVMYFKSHVYHWNIEGSNFNDYHGYFGGLYEELWGAVDPIAEHIRAIDQYAPFSLADLYDAKTVADDQSRVSDSKQMFLNLIEANDSTISALNRAYDLANYAKQNGLSNFLQDRLDVHAKHGWQLRALSK